MARTTSGGDRRALRRAMVLQQPPVERGRLGDVDAHALELAHAGGQAVDLVAARERRVDDGAGASHLALHARSQDDLLAAPRDAYQLVERQRGPCQDDGHGTIMPGGGGGAAVRPPRPRPRPVF